MALSVLLLAGQAAAAFNISNTLGDGMVLQVRQAPCFGARALGKGGWGRGAAGAAQLLTPPCAQRAPQQAVVWGFGDAGASVTATFGGKALPAAKIGADGVWRVKLPATAATKTPATISFKGSDGSTASLKDVLFGDVILCSGQSNMQYTPHSMAGMNNLTAELAAADSYADSIRFFTVGQDTHCGDPKRGQTDCSQPFAELNDNITGGAGGPGGRPCRNGQSCRENWEPASSKALGGAWGNAGQGWNTFSAVCWLTGRDIHDALGGSVPIGLISSNWGGTPVQVRPGRPGSCRIVVQDPARMHSAPGSCRMHSVPSARLTHRVCPQVWQPLASVKDCNPKATVGGTLYNSMIAPYTVGPMALKGATWYQGESSELRPPCGHPCALARLSPTALCRRRRCRFLRLRLPLHDHTLARGLPGPGPVVRLRADRELRLLTPLRP
eukprot:COSAG04_NODE_1526_length_6459_cov_1.920283_5_plen_441_part_00